MSESDLIRNARKIRDEWKKRDAANEAKAKQELDERRRVAQNGQTGGSRNGDAGGGVNKKRKLEETEAPAEEGAERAKRQVTE